MVEQPKDELEQAVVDEKKEKLAKKGINVRSKEEKRLLRRERERMRKNKKKRHTAEADEEEEKDFNRLADTVGFGEVVHAPPTISFKGSMAERKPGTKDLLLKAKLGGGGGVTKKSVAKPPVPSLARKAMLEKERQHVVELYRSMKAAKMKSWTPDAYN